MIKRNLQNLVQSNNRFSNELSEPQSLLDTGDAGLLKSAIYGLRHYLAESNRKHSLEAENRRATEHLHTLTDEQLRDIGITRMDISRAVRLGRDKI
jgi:hypothetical protein